MRVPVATAKAFVKDEHGREVEGLVLTCLRCGQTVPVFGTSGASIKRGFVKLRKACKEKGKNFYVYEGASGPRARAPPRSAVRPLVASPTITSMADERLQRIRVLEAQVEGNREVVAALREIEENLMVRIDDSTEETTALVETAFARIEELRGILHRLENKIDALALSLNSGLDSGRAARSAQSAQPCKFPS
jgi:hypothetical protein